VPQSGPFVSKSGYSASPYTIDIQRNVIKGTGAFAISVGDGQASSNGNVKYNIIFGPGSGTVIWVGGTPNIDTDGNFCDPGISDCSACISAGRCMRYTSPFVGN
jgi:hypothetical protein